MSLMSAGPRASEGDPLPCLEFAGLTEEHGVKDAERLPEFGPAAGCQGGGAA